MTENKKRFDIPNIYLGHVLRVIDGDTIKINISLGFNIYTVQVLRLSGIDTAELRSKDEKKAELARKAKQFVISKVQGKEVKIILKKKGKFRFVADIHYLDNSEEKDLCHELLKEKLAQKYSVKPFKKENEKDKKTEDKPKEDKPKEDKPKENNS